MSEDLELEQIRLKRMQALLQKKEVQVQVNNVPQGIVHLTDESFDRVIKESNLPIFVDYWAEWCRPCHMVAPVIEALEKKYRGWKT